MNVDDAIAIVRDEASFCRRTAEVVEGMDRQDGYAAFLIRKAEAQETLMAEIERLTAVLAERVKEVGRLNVALRDAEAKATKR